MSMPLDWDPRTQKLEKQPALKVPHIPGVLPFQGARNPLTRSNTAHRISAPISTPATKGVPQVYHFDGECEWAAGLEAVMCPDIHSLEVQLPYIRYGLRKGSEVKIRKHYFDLRVTYTDGFRRAIYVKNGSSLARRETQDEIDAIFEAMPGSFADDMVDVNGDCYTRPYRDNLFRIWIVHGQPDAAADAQVEAVARAGSFWHLKDLVQQCELPSNRAVPAAMRLIGRRVLGADWYSVINLHSRVWLA